MKKILLVFFLVYCVNNLKAEVFTVTSNANDGSGSLREAIKSANANPVGGIDYIEFNIQGNSVLDFTIALESELPILTSNIVIDATTQPSIAGLVLPNANIKINLIRVVTAYFSGLRLDNAKNIEIYGLSFSNFKSDPAGSVDDKKAGIFLLNTSDVIIGAPGKPNCFNNNYAGILSPYIIPRNDVVNIKISSNIIGLGENGLNAQPNETGIDLSFLKNSIIGGDTPEEGNLITANTIKGIALGGADGGIKIVNNVIGLDKTFIKTIASPSAIGIYVNGELSIPIISKNIICAQNIGVEMDYVNGGFIISNNKIGTSVTGNESFGNTTGIHVNFCNKGMIGGSVVNDGNSIAYNKTGVLIEIAYPISMLKNSFYCNSLAAVTYKNLPAGKFITQSHITNLSATGASGTYLPNSIIELFYTDSCPDCQGKTWFATVPTDANGNWVYDGPITGKVTSMGTNPDGATSTFSKPFIDNTSASIAGVVCGATTGSIEVNVFDSSVFAWYNVNNPNVVVSNERKLTNVGAGTYFLKAGQNGLCDPPQSANFTIDGNANGINDLQIDKNQTYCGSSMGYIKKITVVNDLPRTWYRVGGGIVSDKNDLENVPAGKYYFTIGDGACKVTSNIYTIENIIITYTARPNQVQIKNATCGNDNGSIAILGYENQKPDSFKWFDAQNNEIRATENLLDVAPGKYTLMGYGINGCSNKIGEFEIFEAPLPIINYAAMQQYINCDGKAISTSGIAINGSTNPYTYKWLNEDGNTVSSLLNISGVAPGKYILKVIDKNGCEVDGQLLDFTTLQSSALDIPNSITPNGDGVNDVWEIKGTHNYPNGDFSIYNRNGNRVFYSKGYAKPFNGVYNGRILPTGVYYYVIDLKTNCGIQSGSLTILR
ncbi:T9SS type B sorting domain-containing protein [Pedobacter sp. LMG 31464]|uniref:T9SS type B sorting domain-containing protein n=1 Tax=Pedobacter planticolens TaxID=2679964 RepID=A0A923E0J3_9SPHI|nr:gliding motility-associated C-terminal domain-containing protein [Pedobacter planticolens]MBB2146030.1 T9SS type B sorting domain-containing protein [Pedobacter planticolens]